ncbi:MAG: dihydroorotase [Rikenellaceae bacterium]
MREIIKGASVYRGGEFKVCDLAIEEGLIVAIEPVIEPQEGDRVVEAAGKHLLPGLVDPHVHLREPGFSRKETIATGTAAAARGGFVAVFSMPNLSPAPDSVEHLQEQLDAIERDALVEVIPYGAITMGQKGRGELVDFESLAPKVGGFSDDGRGVQSDALMREAMQGAKAVGRPIVAHCEVDDLLEGGYIHLGEYCAAHNHKGICSKSEWAQVKRDLELVEQVGCQYHICHISTKESVELLRQAKAKGLRVSGETAAHYLLLTDADLKEEGRFKMNPPLRSASDREALVEGVLDGTIECIATDHASHTAEEKSRGLAASAFGIVGIESSFALMYTYFVRRGVISLERLVEIMSLNARRLFGLKSGAVEVGQSADLVLFDLEREYTIDPADFLSMGHATPFEGWSVFGETILTLFGGNRVYCKQDREK